MASEIIHFEQLEFRVEFKLENDDTDNKVAEVTAVEVSVGVDSVVNVVDVLGRTVIEACQFTPTQKQINLINYKSTD